MNRPALILVTLALGALAPGCTGQKADIGGWLKDRLFPPSTSERVIAVQSPLADQRREALYTIVKDKKARNVESVIKLYCLVARTDEDPLVRSAAVQGLARMEGEPVVPTLRHVLETDTDPYVRSDAAASLGAHEAPAAAEALIAALQSDSSTDVRTAAAESLRRFRTKQAALALAEAVASRNLAVAHNAWEGLRYMTGQDLPRETDPWTEFLTSAEGPFADYGNPPGMPEGESKRPHFTSGIGEFVKGLFEKDPMEAELE